MGFFTTTSGYSSSNIEDLLKDDSLNTYEGLGIMEATYASIAESEMNWFNIMEAAAMTELEYYAATGEEYTYTNEAGFFEGIVNFFKKIWEKIKSIFKKFMVMLGSLVGKDKDFSKKYAKTIRENFKNIPSDAEMKGYKFTYDELSGVVSEAGKQLVTDLTAIKDAASDANARQVESRMKITGLASHFDNVATDTWDHSDAMEKFRGTIFSGKKTASSTMDESETRKVAFAVCRDGEDTPIDIKVDAGTVNTALSNLEEGDKAKRDAAKLYKNTETNFKGLMKEAENIEKNFTKDTSSDKAAIVGANSQIFSRMLALCKSEAACIQSLCGIYLQAVKDKYSQDRKMCVKVLTYKNVKEGATVSHTSEGGYFAGINLI